jgi:hypothetical protein
MEIMPVHPGSCHCGSVKFELALPDGLGQVHRCDCSMCRRRGAAVATVPLTDLTITQGQEHIRLYQFNTMTAKHYFCTNCGIYTHHQQRSDPERYAFNIGCLEGINPFELGEVFVYDGVNHEKDQ